MGIFGPPLDDAGFAAILVSIGDQVREARIDRDWHQDDVALWVGVSASVICRMELARREASVHQLLTVCASLNLRPSDVVRVAEDNAFPFGGGPWTP